jgi:dTDP-4-dehydrorhamnose reductase
MRALVIGADGLLGAALSSAWRQRGHEIIGTTRRRDRARSGETIFLDLAEGNARVRELPRIEVAFICAAISRLAECRISPDVAEQVDVAAPIRIAADLVANGIRVVFLSSSAVFDCREQHMRADRPRNATSVYGRCKAAAEDGILALGEAAAVVRLTKVLTPHAPLLVNWIHALRNGREVAAFSDHRLAPIEVGHAVDALIAVGELGEGGVYQASGAYDISYVEVALYLAKRIGVPLQRVIGYPAMQGGIAPEDVLNFTSMDVGRLAARTGFEAPDPYRVVDVVLDAQTDRAARTGNELGAAAAGLGP